MYVDGFVAAVPAEKKEAYRKVAAEGAAMLKEGEVVVFSWIEYPNKAVRDAVQKRMMSDPRMEALGADMPFDGARMIVGGFEGHLDES